ncbi:hypothetical protein MSAN_01778600 [Mycena sanguinolenta]|uniref:Uncharacterized protein n=1 Tax=Mycena sanguinolenta TaxID=230812 RepID=A0A8H7CS65_9AGAR|nr:hypothetical protein MSAN_01778600 [Mycena sanguinolenta]
MKFLIILLAAASVAVAQVVPNVTSYAENDCAGTPLATWSGEPENGYCQATPGAVSLSIVVGTEKNCEIDLFSTSNCNGIAPNNFTSIPVTDSCYSLGSEFASVRILCITTG